MLGIQQIRVDGTIIDLKRQHLTLEAAQKLVSTGMKDALIELVRLPGQKPQKVGDKVMYVNEEGLLYSLPLNAKATKLSNSERTLGQVLVGDAIIVENEASDFE